MVKPRIVIAFMVLGSLVGCSYYPSEAKFQVLRPLAAAGKAVAVEVAAAKEVEVPDLDLELIRADITRELGARSWTVTAATSPLRLHVKIMEYVVPTTGARGGGAALAFILTGHTLGIGAVKIAAQMTLSEGDTVLLEGTAEARSSYNAYNATAYQGTAEALEGVRQEFARKLAELLDSAAKEGAAPK